MHGVRLGGRYRLDERIGAGGMGEVWRATDEVLGRTVAVEVVLPALLDEPDFVRRFLAEARAMASVHHPGVVTIHDYHGDAAGAYLVMEYVDGESLARRLGRLDVASMSPPQWSLSRRPRRHCRPRTTRASCTACLGGTGDGEVTGAAFRAS